MPDHNDEAMLALARVAIAGGATRSSFAQCAEWAYEEVYRETRDMKAKEAAKLLLDMFREGAFEDTGDAMALDVADERGCAGGDVPAIVEAWLRGVADVEDEE